MRAHWAAMCEMSVKSDRGNRQAVRDWAPGAKISLQQKCKTGLERCWCKLCCATVCICVCEGLVMDGRCQTSQPHPHYETTCWTEAIWRVGHFFGPILRGSDPACWPMIHDHTTWQETSCMSGACPSVCRPVCCVLPVYVLSFLSCRPSLFVFFCGIKLWK